MRFCRPLLPRRNVRPKQFSINCFAFNHLHRISINARQLATDLHLLRATYKDWLPGVAGTDPRLGYRFRGVNYEEGGLHRPPSSFLGGARKFNSLTVSWKLHSGYKGRFRRIANPMATAIAWVFNSIYPLTLN